MSCIFGTAAAGTTIGKVTGGAAASTKAEAVLPYFAGDSSNFVCTLGSGTGNWTASYNIIKPLPLWMI